MASTQQQKSTLTKNSNFCNSILLHLIVFELLFLTYLVSIFKYNRTDKVPHNDGCEEGLDAGYVFPKRERRPVSQHTCSQCIHPDISQWRRALQY